MNVLKKELREWISDGFDERFDLKGEVKDDFNIFFYFWWKIWDVDREMKGNFS